ncbi:MAG: hypothetical protein AAB907_02890, partial [Patescibacteria group bacterium]
LHCSKYETPRALWHGVVHEMERSFSGNYEKSIRKSSFNVATKRNNGSHYSSVSARNQESNKTYKMGLQFIHEPKNRQYRYDRIFCSNL